MAEITQVLARSTEKDVQNTNQYFDEVTGQSSEKKRKRRHLKV